MENNTIKQAITNARQRFADLEQQDEREQYDDFETTIERLTAGGYVDGLTDGIVGGFEYAIALLQNEGFIEHAHILRAQRQSIDKALEVIE